MSRRHCFFSLYIHSKKTCAKCARRETVFTSSLLGKMTKVYDKKANLASALLHATVCPAKDKGYAPALLLLCELESQRAAQHSIFEHEYIVVAEGRECLIVDLENFEALLQRYHEAISF